MYFKTGINFPGVLASALFLTFAAKEKVQLPLRRYTPNYSFICLLCYQINILFLRLVMIGFLYASHVMRPFQKK